jgi:threonyl-tRNA synthetase
MFISPMSFLRGETDEPLEGTEVFGIKPMNCPNAMTLFGITTRSHNDMPIRWAETSTLHRFELSGTLNGLFRTRMFRQDDAHIFIHAALIKSEFENLMAMVKEMYAPFGLSYKFRFGTRPEHFLGEKADWDYAENALQEVLDASGTEYFTVEGEGAFYGPKVDILMKDSLGREWQTGTIQLDLQQPKRFDLHYITSEGTEKMPFVFHRAIFGSLERFLGILTEHYAGAFPLWLAPIQVELLPIADRHAEYAQKVASELKEKGVRVEVNNRAGTLQGKIREAALQKVPYLGIIGDKEVEADSLSVRLRSGEDQGQLTVPDFLQRLVNEIDKKA